MRIFLKQKPLRQYVVDIRFFNFFDVTDKNKSLDHG